MAKRTDGLLWGAAAIVAGGGYLIWRRKNAASAAQAATFQTTMSACLKNYCAANPQNCIMDQGQQYVGEAMRAAIIEQCRQTAHAAAGW